MVRDAAPHVLLSVDRTKSTCIEGRLSLPGDEGNKLCSSYSHDPALAIPPGIVRLYDPSGKKWRKLKSLAAASVAVPKSTGSGLWLLRRSTAEPILRAHASEGLVLREAQLCDAQGAIDEDWIYLDIRSAYPLDRDTAEATYADPANAHASKVETVTRFAWSAAREPRDTVFRCGEFPATTFVRSDVFTALAKATRGALVAAEPPYAGSGRVERVDLVTSWHPQFLGPLPVVPPQPELAARAASAFWQAYERKDAGDRKLVLESPHYAYWLARAVDRRASDDTRRAACQLAFYAFVYARDVDRGVRDDTRAAAATNAKILAAYEKAFASPDAKPTAPAAPPQPLTIERRPLPRARLPRFADADSREGKLPTHVPFDADLRGDTDILLERGLAHLGAAADDPPEAIVEKVHALISRVQKGEAKLGKKDLPGVAVAWAEQLARALGWQWATVVYDATSKVAGVISPDRSHAHFPLHYIGRLAKKGARENTVALLFNMLRDPDDGAKPWSYESVE